MLFAYLDGSALISPPRCSLLSSRKNCFGWSITWILLWRALSYQVFGVHYVAWLVWVGVLRDKRGSPHFIGKLHDSYIYAIKVLMALILSKTAN